MLKKRFRDFSGRKKSSKGFSNPTLTDAAFNVLSKPASLINQQSVFGYNDDGTRKVNPFGSTNVYKKHEMLGTPRGVDKTSKADLQHRLNLHFQSVRDSDVAFLTT